MSLAFVASSVAAPSHFSQLKADSLASVNSFPSNASVKYRFLSNVTSEISQYLAKRSARISKATRRNLASRDQHTVTDVSLNWDDLEALEPEEEEGSPWEGAIMYRRNASVSHIEYCTTLERLGLGNLSTDVSKSRASIMGLRVTKAVKDYPQGTPVQISVDVTRKRKKLRLDGIIKTVITLYCNRCGQPAAECIYSNFSLLLSEEPIEEPDVITIGLNAGQAEEDDGDDDASIDWDDRLHFPLEESEIDISKNLRDLIHVEITINGVCDPMCKGACLQCGTNLNTSSCNCSSEKASGKTYGPLGNLREQMQSNS
ncbi:unnamed protein product [Linum tenue]|uniref:Large ribosomal RNA subunit accumulation protein YCED homolog 1, chloroplastic n=1 Tax=Linum tenue TaxID=586396 RepID=A0AAV0JZX2_9ROSI|nr:unnamed protein product [Linum tenue]CAI0416215.1 unnamed protein product [Linum tenue]